MKSLAFYIEDIRRRFPYAYDSQNKPHFLQFQASPKNIVLQIFGIQLRCIYKQIYFITPRYLIWNQTHHWFIIQFDDFSFNLQIVLLRIEITYVLRILLYFDFCFWFDELVIWKFYFLAQMVLSVYSCLFCIMFLHTNHAWFQKDFSPTKLLELSHKKHRILFISMQI